MTAYVFPGQGAQFVGMGKELYQSSDYAKSLFEKANEILGFRITDLMFHGTDEDLRQTNVTQPAIFIHSVIAAMVDSSQEAPLAVAGHSLGEFSALVVAGALSFEDGLRLVSLRAQAMRDACDEEEGAMAAILNLQDTIIDDICQRISHSGHIVVAANYNSPKQIVISGNIAAVDEACVLLKEAGARRALKLPVGGAFHSPLMESARMRLEAAINQCTFHQPSCPIYQNVDALPHTDVNEIRNNLLHQLTSPVKWTIEVKNMLADGITNFVEYGPGEVLTGLIAKIR